MPARMVTGAAPALLPARRTGPTNGGVRQGWRWRLILARQAGPGSDGSTPPLPAVSAEAVRPVTVHGERGRWPQHRHPAPRCGALRRAWRRWRTRQLIAELDAHMLKDIGASRAEALAEYSKPFWRA